MGKSYGSLPDLKGDLTPGGPPMATGLNPIIHL